VLTSSAAIAKDNAETAFERVTRTNTLRCAYWDVDPISYKDINSGELKGFAVALMTELSKLLSVKVEWVEEVNFATMLTGLEAGRYDSICSGVYLAGVRARAMEYTDPYLYSVVMPVVRVDDHRFDVDVEAINDPAIKVVVWESLSIAYVSQRFPRATQAGLPEMSSVSQALVDVADGKADVVLLEPGAYRSYNDNNPGKLRMIHTDRPLRVFPWVLPVPKGEHDLASFINAGLIELVYNGDIARLARTNGIQTGDYFYPHPQMEQR
jgi:ABC-type amino acid transport substrate-binding protein